MAAFRYPRRTQPSGPVGIDWGNPIARGLVFCQSPDGQELVYKRKPTFVNAPGSGVNRYGKFYSFGVNKSITYPQFGAELPVSGPATMLWIQEPRSAAAYSTIAQFRPNSSVQPFLIYQSLSDANYAFVAGLQSQSNPSYSAAVGVSVNNKVDLFALRTKTSLSSITAADWSLFRNGISLTSSGTQTFSSSTATVTAIGLLNGTSDPFEGLIGNFCVWNRALSDAEIKSLSDNPWQIFTPQSRQILVPTAGGGVNYSLTCNAGAYVLAGQDATLTYTAGTANYTLACDAGAYVLAGQDAALTYIPGSASVAYSLLCDAGAYAIAGQDATLTYVSNAPVAYSLACEAGAYSITGQEATFSFSGGAQDTHDGYWSKQWEKLRKKKPIIEEVIELVQEEPAIALAEVKEAVKREYPQVDYTQVLNNIQLQRFIAEQLLITLELRRIQDDEDDIEILMML